MALSGLAACPPGCLLLADPVEKIDPELMIRMLIVGYCYGIRFERKLCEEVKLHLGYRWFCRLELDIRLNQRMSTHACSPPFQLADSYD